MSGPATSAIVTAEHVLDPGGAARGNAVLLSGGQIVATGTRGDLVARAPDATLTDLPGATLMPGLVESHIHPLYAALTASWADCRSPHCGSITDIVTALRRHSIEAVETEGGWIRGWGYDDTLIAEMRHPTRAELDAVSRHRPVVVSHISGHFAVANTRALELTGITESTVAADDPGYPRDGDRRLTGLLWEVDAVSRLLDHIPTPSMTELRSALRDTLRRATTFGITTVHDLGIGLMCGLDELDLYRDLDAAGDLPLHVVGFLRGDLALAETTPPAGFTAQSAPGSRFRLAGTKFWSDGSIQGLSAALRAPYACRADAAGELLHDPQQLADLCTRAAAMGAQVAVHANGDAAVAATTAALAPLQAQRPAGHGPHRIEHCQVADQAALEAIHRAGLGVTFFANHIYYWGDRHRDLFLGKQRAENIDALGWAAELGLRFGLHSDCPITPMDPVRTIWSATTRRTRQGDVLGEQQRIDIARAVRAMTVDSHWLVGDEPVVGTLQPGQRADLVAVDQDLSAQDAEALRHGTVVATMVDGEWITGP